MGFLSLLDGIGPRDIGLDRLGQRLEKERITEIILATNPTVEGEATANHIADMRGKYGVLASRIAHGVPVGGELEIVEAPCCQILWPVASCYQVPLTEPFGSVNYYAKNSRQSLEKHRPDPHPIRIIV